jgi:hypothetical protein
MTPSTGQPPASPDQPPRTGQPASGTWARTSLAAQIQRAGPGLQRALQAHSGPQENRFTLATAPERHATRAAPEHELEADA